MPSVSGAPPVLVFATRIIVAQQQCYFRERVADTGAGGVLETLDVTMRILVAQQHTWRAADSIPKAVLERWEGERDQWLRAHGIDPTCDDWQHVLEMLPEESRREFHKLFATRWNALLDECHGECVLRQPELSLIVEGSLRHLDGQRYHLEAFVVMPNHVHVLVGVTGRGEMKQVCRSWKNFTATQINKALGRHGQFWQWESFDHLVRGPASLEKFRDYILKNPVKARLKRESIERGRSQSSLVAVQQGWAWQTRGLEERLKALGVATRTFVAQQQSYFMPLASFPSRCSARRLRGAA